MRYVLLAWNPGSSDDEQYTPEEWLDQMVIPLQEGRPPEGDRWSIGTNWKVIEVGDLVCMLRQGIHGRGIVATEIVTRSAFRDAHWNAERAGDAWYVNVAWGRAFDLNQMITIEELEQEVPDFSWNRVYGSGRIITGVAADDLAALLGQAPPQRGKDGRGGGQEMGKVEHNRLVELEAMRIVTAGYQARKYVVKNVSDDNLGWDLEARRRGEVAYVEVKGTTGPLPEFFLTPNEHRAADRKIGWIAVVITSIFGRDRIWYEFSGSEVVVAARPVQSRVTALPSPSG